jgi:hypothetical protein
MTSISMLRLSVDCVSVLNKSLWFPSCVPVGSKGHGDNNSLDDMAEMRVSHVTAAAALFSKGSSRPLTGDHM